MIFFADIFLSYDFAVKTEIYFGKCPIRKKLTSYLNWKLTDNPLSETVNIESRLLTNYYHLFYENG
jgi:hypothetical protein